VREQVMAWYGRFPPRISSTRVDEIIPVHRLQKSEMAGFVEIQFGRLQKLLEERKIVLTSMPRRATGWRPRGLGIPLRRAGR